MNRRIISTILTVVMTGVMAVCAFGDTRVGFYDEVLTVSFHQCLAEEDYMFFILEDGADEENCITEQILFMDQLVASEEGSLEIAFVSPEYDACVAVLGGVFTDGGDSPRALGQYARGSALYAPGNLTEVGDEAFAGTSFTHVFLGESVTSIGSMAFSGCEKLSYIYIPMATTDIAENAFSGCEPFTIACQEGSIAESYAISMGYAYKLV